MARQDTDDALPPLPRLADGAGPRTRAESVADELRRMIIGGQLAPGARLRQVQVAKHFDVSTTPVREAFASLAQEGFVRQDAHRGVEVFHPTVEDIRENYEIRLALEPLAAKVAAGRITDEQLAQVERLQVKMKNPVKFRLGTELNRQFHFAIYAAAQRPLLMDMIERLRRSADAYVQLFLSKPIPGYFDAVRREHGEIVKALQARSPEEAYAAMAQHLQHSLDQISHLLAKSS